MTNLLFPKARHEGPTPESDALADKVRALEARLAELQAASAPPAPVETAVEAFHRQQEEFHAAWKAQQEREAAEREADKARAREADLELARMRPQVPSCAEMRSLYLAVRAFIAQNGSGSDATYLREEEVFSLFEPVIDGLMAFRAGRIQGWNLPTRKALGRLSEAFEQVVGRWGWRPLIDAPTARQALVERLRREWEVRTGVPRMRAAELWERISSEYGVCEVPPRWVVELAEEARVKDLVPYEIRPEFLYDKPGVANHEGSLYVEKLFDEADRFRRVNPFLGHSRPVMDQASRDLLGEALAGLRDVLPREEPVVYHGSPIGGLPS